MSQAKQKQSRKHRGIYEHPPGSGIWWAQYFVAGKRHRERAGSKSNAIALYRKRKSEALTDRKLPELNRRQVTLGELFDDAIRFAELHHKTPHDTKLKAESARPRLGALWADSVTHEDLADWVEAREVTNATFNRYKSFFSLCYREGLRAGKVKTNPAKLIRRRRESNGRKRFLSQAEYTKVCAAIQKRIENYQARDNEHLEKRWRRRMASFITSVWTGMRRGEQSTLEIHQINWDRHEIQLTETKNGDSREIPIVPEVCDALKQLIGDRRSGLVFERERGGTEPANIELNWFEDLLDKLEIGSYTWHNNRHTFCSWLAIGGTPLLTIKELAGHRSIATTAKYAHLSRSHKRTELEAVASSHREAKVTPMPSATKTAIASRVPRKARRR